MPIIADATLPWAGIITALTDQFTVAAIAEVLSLTIAACVGLVFAWWGMRKGVRMVMAAFKKGKIRI